MSKHYAVFGQPVAHSLSPQIHVAFGRQTGIAVDYRTHEAAPSQFAAALSEASAVPIHLQAAYTDLGYTHGGFPNAERQASRALSLPLFPEMTDDEIDTVADAIVRFS